MDYLLRDSHYCGVQYGTFDLARILDTVTIYDEDPDGALRLGITHGGFHAVEAFVLARYFMFTQVYFHRTRRAYDFLLTDFVSSLGKEETGKCKYPSSLEEYLKWTDWRILSEASMRSDSSNRNLAWRLIAREHPKPVYETGDHAEPGTSIGRSIDCSQGSTKTFPTSRHGQIGLRTTLKNSGQVTIRCMYKLVMGDGNHSRVCRDLCQD